MAEHQRISYCSSMLVLLSLLAFAGSPPPVDAVAELSRGSGLYRVCQAEMRLMNLPSLTGATESDLLNGSYCVGYLNGYVANLQPVASACPAGTPTSSLVRTYVDYMARNPDLMDKDRRLGLGLALRDSYPCPLDTLPGQNAVPGARSTL